MVNALRENSFKGKRRGPVVLCIMDGVAYGKYEKGDAFKAALKENFDQLSATCPGTILKAHGRAVGMPSDSDMGNSEVGHNAMGCGRVFEQGASLVSEAIISGSIFKSQNWNEIIDYLQNTNGTMHLIGLISDGNVHSHINHLKALVENARKSGLGRLRVHGLLDGRDVGATSALDYFEPMDKFFAGLSDDSFSVAFASGGGRMNITMDRYNADWAMVEKGWHTHVLGEGPRYPGVTEAITDMRKKNDCLDQDMPPFILTDAEGEPCGRIYDGDAVILFNFRGDRAIEISTAFEAGHEFNKFDRVRIPKIKFAGMTEYDGDLHIPGQYLVEPPAIDRTMAEYLVATGVRQYSISETQKFGHITYFWNGNRSGYFNESLETYDEIPSDNVPFQERPAMKCAEIADNVIEAIRNCKHEFIKLNFPNGDMVGHTGIFQAVVASMEIMDIQIGRICRAIKEAGGILILTADHGNADDMFERDKKGNVVLKENGNPKAKTSHSLNPVPCLIYDPEYSNEYPAELNTGLGISSIAATCMNLLGYEAPEDYSRSLVEIN